MLACDILITTPHKAYIMQKGMKNNGQQIPAEQDLL